LLTGLRKEVRRVVYMKIEVDQKGTSRLQRQGQSQVEDAMKVSQNLFQVLPVLAPEFSMVGA
jgi:hypothetical protein